MLTNASSDARTAAAAAAIDGDDIVRTWREIAPHMRRTPTVAHRLLSRRFGCPVHVKLESSQLLGSCKLRGWLGYFAGLDEAQRRRGIVTFAEGEHVRPMLAAAEQFGTTCERVVAESATGRRAVRAREIVVDAASPAELSRAAHERAGRTGALFVDHTAEPAWIAGAGSAGFELVEQVEEPLDIVFVPVGTGTFAIGVAIAIRSVCPDTRIFGVQVEKDAATRRIGSLDLAAALATRRPAATERVLDQLLDKRITVTEAEIHDAIRCYGETLRQPASGAGAAALAGARQIRDRIEGATIGVMLSGGNIDAATLRRVLDGEPAEDSTDQLRQLVGHSYL
jgi:threonine dehydratase